MCELLSISSAVPVRLDLSLEALARHGTAEGLNRDGWGVASYQGRDARLVKEPTPAGSSEIVRFIEEHDFWSTCIVYHLRHAVGSAVSYENTHPFERELGAQTHVFCHNGSVSAGIGRLASSLGRFRPIGETDSELAFCVLLARLEESWLSADGVPALDARMEIVASTAAELRDYGPANFLYCDGDVLFVHSHWRAIAGPGSEPMSGLHVLEDVHDCTTSAVTIAPSRGHLFMAASVPFTQGPWRPMAEGELLAVRGGRVVAENVPSLGP